MGRWWRPLRRLSAALLWLSFAGDHVAAHSAAWVEVRTGRHVIVTDAGEERGVEVARAVEEIRAALQATLPAELSDTAPLSVLALARSRDFYRLLPEYRGKPRGAAVAAATFSGPEGEEIALRLDTGAPTQCSVVYHETVHSLTRRLLPGLPVWLEEGLAELWSTAVLETGEGRLGEEQPAHRQYLRREGLLPLAELIRTPERTPGAPVQGVNLYASAWALAHYLVVGGGAGSAAALPEVWARLAEYVERCRRLGDPLVAFEETFGPVEATQNAVVAYLAADRLPSLTLSFAGRTPEWHVRPLREAEVRAVLGAFLVRRGALETARPYLEAALQAEPELASAVVAMGHLAFAAGDDSLAVSLLSRALEGGRDDLVMSHLLVATLRREEGADRDPAGASSVIRRLVSLRPELAPAWIQLAATYSRSGASWPLVEDACRSAVESRPGSAWFRLLWARAALVGGRATVAERESRIATELVRTSDDATLANNVCWYGGVGGLAVAVLPACEHAVRLAPERGLYRDSRALVRALVGDLEGAREDLEAFLASADALDSTLRSQREVWLRSLEAGVSPFTVEVLEGLSDLPF